MSALALCHDLPGADAFIQQYFTESEWAFYQKLLARPSSVVTSSMGRLFDAVAALLGLLSNSSFEGEAAIRLEVLARSHRSDFPSFQNLESLKNLGSLNPKIILKSVLADLKADVDKGQIAYRFHCNLAHLVSEMAMKFKVRKLAFSGGVFQNSLLVDLIINELGEECELYFHKELSPNDECISFGQLAVAFLAAEGTSLQETRQEQALLAIN